MLFYKCALAFWLLFIKRTALPFIFINMENYRIVGIFAYLSIHFSWWIIYIMYMMRLTSDLGNGICSVCSRLLLVIRALYFQHFIFLYLFWTDIHINENKSVEGRDHGKRRFNDVYNWIFVLFLYIELYKCLRLNCNS